MWSRPSAPSENVPAPKCPSCRKPFYINRYGKIFKKTDVDLSEQSLIRTSSRGLQSLERRYKALPDPEPRKDSVAGTTPAYPESRYGRCAGRLTRILAKASDERKLTDNAIFSSNASKTFGLNKADMKRWTQHSHPFTRLLRQVKEIAQRTSPQQDAWDASYAKLFRSEMSTGRCRPEAAKRLAHRALGIPRPSGKQQYSIQATCLSIQIRHRLARIVEGILDSVSDLMQKRHWRLLASTLLTSALVNAEIARDDARDAVLDRSYYAVSYLCKSLGSNRPFSVF